MPAPFGAGISVCQRTCTVAHIGGRRAGPMCPAAQGDTDSPCLPLRGRWQREALAEGEIPHGFLSPSRLRRQPPPRGGLPARHRRADGTSYPKGICSAALHCRTPSPTGGLSRPSCRAGPMCPAARYACFPAGHAGPALQDSSAAALTGRRTPRAFVPLRSTAGRHPLRPMCGRARLSFRRGRCPHRPAVGNRIPAAGHMGPALQGACVRPLSKSPNGLF